MLTVIRPEEISENLFKLVSQDWMLITAGPPENHNTMTASWGGFGVMWGRNVSFCALRPQRYTLEFMERSENFTLSFFSERYRPALEFCGNRSGRDVDKAKATGLTPVAGVLPDSTHFAEARLVIACRKIYAQDIDPTRFLDPSIEENYPSRDYHRIVVGEIVEVGRRES